MRLSFVFARGDGAQADQRWGWLHMLGSYPSDNVGTED